MCKVRILFLASNPGGTSQLDLLEEMREVELQIRGVKYRDQILFEVAPAARPADVIEALREEKRVWIRNV
jgi:hypothetical protein